jgi:glycosyltransferase involved in cell wall biosynthesis
VHVVEVADSRFPVREPFAGGMQALTWHLVRGLRERGVRVSVFAGKGSDLGPDVNALPFSPLRISDAARRDVSMEPEEWVQEHHAYLQMLLDLASRSDVDVVHNNTLHYLPIAMAASLAAPTMTTLHTPPTPWLESAVSLSTRSCSSYVAVSAFTANQWSHLTAARVIPNGVDPRRWPFQDGGSGLVWFGRIAPEKAPHLAIEIARRADRHLRLAGPVTDAAYWRDDVLPRLGDDVEYVGHLAQHELAKLIGSSALSLVTPVWDEPYGLVAAESLACGTPVLAFDRGGVSEFLDETCARLVPGGDVAAAVAAVPEAESLDRRAATRHASIHCSLDRMLDRYVQVLESLRGAPVG